MIHGAEVWALPNPSGLNAHYGLDALAGAVWAGRRGRGHRVVPGRRGRVVSAGEVVRCGWATGSPEEIRYHDDEWGVPVHDDARLFESLTLEGAQAGLSWSTILKKREGYRAAFHGFDPARVAAMDESNVERLLRDPGIVRHRGKIESTLNNARRVLEVQAEVGSLDAYVWGFVDGTPIRNRWTGMGELPASSPLSTALSKDLKRRGFRFVGPTTVYAFMQAVGMVNDHLVGCFRHGEVGAGGARTSGSSG